MAYAAAITHGLQEEAEVIKAKLATASADPNTITTSNNNTHQQLLIPPIPIMKLHESNWPLLTVSRGYFEGLASGEEEKKGSLSSKMANIADENEEELGETEWDNLDIPDEDDERGGNNWALS